MYIVTGANGQLGSELRRILPPDTVWADLPEVDITDEPALRAFFEMVSRQKTVDCIINCAAYTQVDKAESEPETAEAVNARGPANLARLGVPMIQISTDYVFDGTGHLPYREDDTPNPVSVYGRTKLAGEQQVLENADSAVIIRTAWLYSPYGKNFVRTITKYGKSRGQLRVVFDQVGTPTNAADLAQAIAAIAPKMAPGTKSVYHFTNEGVCSWYDFACEIIRLQNIDCTVSPCESSEYKTAAVRPAFSVLNKGKIKQDFGIAGRHWAESLADSLKNEYWQKELS